MKTTAENLKVNQTVKFGNVWVLITEIINTTFKNGNFKILVNGIQQSGVIKRRGYKNQIVEESQINNIEFKPNTKVQIR